jgi:sec-independent protein translocase protein TatA
MGSLSIWHIVILATIALLLFGGRGKVSDLMGDVAKGIKSFRAGMSDLDPAPEQPPAALIERHEEPVATSTKAG